MNQTLPRLIFAGTPDFAAVALQALIEQRPGAICAVYTQPDRPAGRGRKLQASPVKQLALEHGIPVYQPDSLKGEDEQQALRQLDPDLMIVAAYGLLLPQSVLDIPRQGCINIHASLLPRWRGAAPIQRCIEAGDSESGVCIMQMAAGLDTGPVIARSACALDGSETGGILHDRLAALGATALTACLDEVLADTATLTPQDDDQAVYAAKLSKEEAAIDWQTPAVELCRKIRAFNPWPVAHGMVGNTSMRIWHAVPLDGITDVPPGTILSSSRQGIDVATGQGICRLLQIQLPGKKPVAVSDYMNSNPQLV